MLDDAEVGQVDAVGRLLDQDVRRLDVAVDEIPLVRGVERARGLLEDEERASALERAPSRLERLQVGALDVAHRDVELAFRVARVVDRDDVRVVDLRGAGDSRSNRSRKLSSSLRAGDRSLSATLRPRRCARRGRRRSCRPPEQLLEPVAGTFLPLLLDQPQSPPSPRPLLRAAAGDRRTFAREVLPCCRPFKALLHARRPNTRLRFTRARRPGRQGDRGGASRRLVAHPRGDLPRPPPQLAGLVPGVECGGLVPPARGSRAPSGSPGSCVVVCDQLEVFVQRLREELLDGRRHSAVSSCKRAAVIVEVASWRGRAGTSTRAPGSGAARVRCRLETDG